MKNKKRTYMKVGVVLLMAMIILPGLSVVSIVKGDVPDSPYAVNQIIVKLRPGHTLQSLNLSSHYGLLDSEENLSSYLLSVNGMSEEQAIQELSAKPGVMFAELNAEFHAFFEPNDPLWIYQYGPKNIKCPEAWNVEPGDHSIVVSVVDTGIDYTHPDLVNHYKASGSWNFVAHNADSLDDYGHGTHCAGIIAAETNNGLGIAGVADVKIMAMKVLNAEGKAFSWMLCRGIVRSALMGADIISMSWGAYMLHEPLLMKLACNFSYALGATLVAASGNEGNPNIGWVAFPAAFSTVIAVGATDRNNTRAAFSSWGDQLDVMAPGVKIVSTMPTYHVMLNDAPYNLPMNYANASGTSMACPCVAGVIALYLSKNGARVSNSKVYQRLTESATDLGDYRTGYGLVNASAILQYNDAGDSAPAIPSLPVNAIAKIMVSMEQTSIGTIWNIGMNW
jgi:thermitase